MNILWWGVFALCGALAATCAVLFKKWLDVRLRLADAEARVRELEGMESLTDAAINATKIALAETGALLSSKLMDDHKRENAASSEQFHKLTKDLTTPLAEQLTKVSGLVAHLHTNQDAHAGKLTDVMNALKTPTGSGKIAEIGLENLLKSFGLERGRDFETQFTVTSGGSRLRPDALVYLPNGRIMVVDCKASSFLLDGTADEGLKTTMNQHLRDLESKDYRAAITAEFKKARGAEPVEVWSVMYVPTESLAERLKTVDAEFTNKLMKADIILASPATLHGLLSIARLQIENEKQLAGSEKIVEAASALLDGITDAFKHVEKLGRALKTSVESFNSFAGSANQYVLSRSQKLTQLGVAPARGKTLPARLGKFEIVQVSESDSAPTPTSEDTPALNIVKNS
jgi:DNA recombination protein RmuC